MEEDVRRLSAEPDTVFIDQDRIATPHLEALNAALKPSGNVLARSFAGPREQRDSRRYAYVTFREGHVDSIRSMLSSADVEPLSRLPLFEFDDGGETFRAWHDSAVAREGPFLRVTMKSPGSFLSVPVSRFAPWFVRGVRMRTRSTKLEACRNPEVVGSLYWLTEEDRDWGANGKYVTFKIEKARRWKETYVDLTDNSVWNGSGIVTALRYDPADCAGEMLVDFLRFE